MLSPKIHKYAALTLFTRALDLLSSRHHSEDFQRTRCQLISTRLQLMCLLFAISVPLSSLFDFMVLERPLAVQILPVRLSLSGALLLLFILSKRTTTRFAYPCLILAFVLPCLFYLKVEGIFDAQGRELPLALAATPLLTVSMLGLFPLTLRFGCALFSAICCTLISFELLYLNSSAELAWQQLWQLCLFGGVALWLQLGQLSMLLKLYRESTVDPLTGLINRRVLMRQLAFSCEQSEVTHKPCSLMIFDLDKFKRINDNFGHQCGDKVLCALANVLSEEATHRDIAARFGGEEFVLLMPNTALDLAVAKAQHIARCIRALQIQSDSGESIQVTSSIGISQFSAGTTPSDLIQRADEQLYRAKREGRDCIRY